MERTEFLRRQADRFLRLAQECTDPKIRHQLVSMANEYREMLQGAAPGHQNTSIILPHCNTNK